MPSANGTENSFTLVHQTTGQTLAIASFAVIAVTKLSHPEANARERSGDERLPQSHRLRRSSVKCSSLHSRNVLITCRSCIALSLALNRVTNMSGMLISYADDATILHWGHDINQMMLETQQSFSKTVKYFNNNRLKANPSKTNAILNNKVNSNCSLNFNISCKDENVAYEHSTKFLGIYIDHKFTRTIHIDYIL